MNIIESKFFEVRFEFVIVFCLRYLLNCSIGKRGRKKFLEWEVVLLGWGGRS